MAYLYGHQFTRPTYEGKSPILAEELFKLHAPYQSLKSTFAGQESGDDFYKVDTLISTSRISD